MNLMSGSDRSSDPLAAVDRSSMTGIGSPPRALLAARLCSSSVNVRCRTRYKDPIDRALTRARPEPEANNS